MLNMPCKDRIDAPGALHHNITRSLDRSRVSGDDVDRDFFLEQLGMIVQQSKTQCFAWALIPNHFRLRIIRSAMEIGKSRSYRCTHDSKVTRYGGRYDPHAH